MKPEAVVTLDSHEMTPDGIHDGNLGWHQWFDSGESWTHVLEEGRNDLEFIATFDDRSTLTSTVAVVCDPSLQAYPGYITAMTTNDDGTYNLVFDAGRIDDQPDGWGIIDTEPVTLRVEPDVVFVAFNGQPAGDTRFIFTAAEFAEQTSDCTPAAAVPYELLVDSDNHVHQALQLEPTLHFCLGE